MFLWFITGQYFVVILKKKSMIEPTKDFLKTQNTSSVKKNNIYSILLNKQRFISGRLYFSFFLSKSDTLVDRQSQDCNFLRQLFDIGNENFSSGLKKMSEKWISFIEKILFIGAYLVKINFLFFKRINCKINWVKR